jgi:PAS domain S-box-containing protein
MGDAPNATGDPVSGGSHAHPGHLVCDPQLLILDVDLAARRILTRRRDQLIGQPFLRYLGEDGVAEFGALAHQLVIDGLGSARSEVWLLPERAEAIPVHITVTHLPGTAAGASDNGVILLALDPITRSGADPSPADGGAGDLGDRSADLITRYRLWPEPAFTYVSRSSEDVLGYPPKAFYADPMLLHELIDEPEDIERLQRIYEGEERREPVLLHLRHRDGNVIVLEQRSTGVRDGEGRLLAVEGIARDVTAHIEEQERYATAQGTTRAFRKLAPDDLDVAEPIAVVQAAIDAVCDHLGWPLGHAVLVDAAPGHVVSAAWHDLDPDRSAPLRAGAEAGPLRIDADLVAEAVLLMEQVVHELPDEQSTSRSVLAARCGYRYAVTVPVVVDDAIGAVLEFYTDGHRRPSQAVVAGVADLADDVGRSLTRNRAVLNLIERDQARQEFVARAAHELRGPIGAISLMASALAREAATSEHAEMASALDALAAQAERIRAMATRLLELSQLEEGRLELRPERVPVERAVRAAVSALPRTEGVRVETAIAPELFVFADPALLDSILSNLLVNAARYARSAVCVEAGQRQAGVAISVTDDGPGVPETLVSHLFQPIASPLATPDHGGIGLALVGRMASAMGGAVAYEGGPDRGARFVVTLRVAGDDEVIRLA